MKLFFLVCFLMIFVFSALAGEIGFDEQFSLAPDRSVPLKQLIPGTEDFYYYSALFHQNRGEYKKVHDILTQWIKRYSYSQRVEEMLHRQALFDFSENPGQSLRFIKQRLNLIFNHQKQVLKQTVKYPNELSPTLISRETLKAQAMNDYQDLSGFEDSALDSLLNEQLNPDRRRNLLQRMTRPEGAGLAKMVVDDLQYEHSGGFGSLSIHRNMLLSQLEECQKLMPELLKQTNFVEAVLLKLQPGEDSNWEYNDNEKEAFFNRMWAFVRPLVPAFNSLKANILYHWLEWDLSRGIFVKSKFLEYLRLPRNVSYINNDFNQRDENRYNQANINADFRIYSLMQPIGDDEPMVRSYLQNFLVEDNDFSEYADFIEFNYLKKLFAETKILNNIGDMEKWYSMLSPEDVKTLKERIELEFLPTCRKVFATSDQVVLDVKVKNIKTLIKKIYKLNVMNYYRDRGEEISTAIDLDGLVPNEEKVHVFNEPEYVSHIEHFETDSLNKPGVYVIELIGNGKSSRALVRKGRLSFMERMGSAGHVFTVFDDEYNQVKDASLWLSGHEYQPDENGEITVPFSTNPRTQKVILKHGDFASLHSFNHMSENYDLNCGFFVDRESLIDGQNSQVVIRPRLSIYDNPIDIALLQESSLVISTTDRDGISASKEVNNFKLFNDKESTFEFKVPEKLSQISFTIRGKVENLSLGKKIDLSSSRSYEINGIDKTEKIEAFHVRHIDDKYDVELLGKSGEPKIDMPVQVEIKHRCFTRSVNVTLQTNQEGVVSLGKLENIQRVTLQGPEGTNKSFEPINDLHTYSSVIHGLAGTSIFVPFMGGTDQKIENIFSLYELRANSYAQDFREKVKLLNGYLVIDDLPAGDFELLLKQMTRVIKIRITRGKKISNYLLSSRRSLQARASSPLQISKIENDQKRKVLTIKIENCTPSSRVHIVGTRFLPEFSIFHEIGGFNLPELKIAHLIPPISRFLSGRSIGDEYQYILERKFARLFPGNMLKRPSLLLNPWSLRKTDTQTKEAAAGSDWTGSPEPEGMSQEGAVYSQKIQDGRPTESGFANLDFLPEPSLVLTNLKPNEQGEVEINLNNFQPRQQIHILAQDFQEAVFREYTLPESKETIKDLRMTRALDPQKHFSEQKNISFVQARKTFEIADITTTKMEVFDSLGSVYAIFSTLNPNPNFVEFGFILNWPNFSPEKKKELYSKYACHELNFFLFKKDPEFFQKVIKPFLANKRDKTFLDHWLLKDNLSFYTEPWAFQRLNIVERILLAQEILNESSSIKRHAEDLFDLIPPDIERFNYLFQTGLKGSSLETGDRLGLKAGLKKVMAPPMLAPSTVGGLFSKNGPPPPPSAPMPMKEEKRARVAGKSKMSMELSKQNVSGAEMEPMDDEMDSAIMKDAGRRRAVRQFFRQLDKTEEWVENNYYHLPIERQVANLITVNAFWRDFALQPASQPFLSKNFAEASRNFSEMMFALSVLDLPFSPAKHTTDFKIPKMVFTPSTGVIIFHKEIKPTREIEKTQSILTGQNFFAQNDRYRYEKNERFDKFVTEEFQTRRVYGCQVVLTNPTSSRQKIDALLQIPNGSIPVLNGFFTKSVHIQIEPFSTKTHEYYFYFPFPGKFIHYPVHVSENEKLIAKTEPFVFQVVDELTKVDKTSWPYISQNGSDEEVLNYLKNNNIDRLDLGLIAFRMRDPQMFSSTFELLKSRHVYNDLLWSYSIFHKNIPAIRDFLAHSSFANQCGTTIESPILSLNPVVRYVYQHKEYWPLVNARVYPLGKKREILNDQFCSQYHALLADLKYHPSLSDYDRLAVVYYMLLQDRIEDGTRFFEEIKDPNIFETIQYNYLKAYLAFSQEKVDDAVKIAQTYKDYPVDRWRNLFLDVLAQAGEIEGKKSQVIDNEDRDQKQAKLSDTQPGFEFNIEKRTIALRYQNLNKVRINYYLMDLELLFSRNPFVQEVSGQFSIIQPNESHEIDLLAEKKQQVIELPEKFRDRNVMVEIVGGAITKSQGYYPHSLEIQIIESYGQIRVNHLESRKPLSKVYVKVYARMKDGRIVFYKDGYTDLRGKFDYSSLSTNQLDGVERFSILIMSEKNGSVVREAAPPKM